MWPCQLLKENTAAYSRQVLRLAHSRASGFGKLSARIGGHRRVPSLSIIPTERRVQQYTNKCVSHLMQHDPAVLFKLLFLNKGALLTIFRFWNPYQGLDSVLIAFYAKVKKSMSRCMIALHRMWLEPLPLSVSPCHLPDKWEPYQDRRHGKTKVASPWKYRVFFLTGPLLLMHG